MTETDRLLRAILIIIGAIVLLPLLVMVFAWPMMGMWNGGHMWDGATGVGWAMIFLWLVVLTVIVLIAMALNRGIPGGTDRAEDLALEELRLAYARGDLDADEFDERRARLIGER